MRKTKITEDSNPARVNPPVEAQIPKAQNGCLIFVWASVEWNLSRTHISDLLFAAVESNALDSFATQLQYFSHLQGPSAMNPTKVATVRTSFQSLSKPAGSFLTAHESHPAANSLAHVFQLLLPSSTPPVEMPEMLSFT